MPKIGITKGERPTTNIGGTIPGARVQTEVKKKKSRAEHKYPSYFLFLEYRFDKTNYLVTPFHDKLHAPNCESK